jgi:osmotically-inducible protein OsmY
MTDVELKKAVEAELNFEPSIEAAAIGVAVKDGIVTLTGHVDSYWAKVAAECAASRVAGVKAVANELDVRLPTSSERTDEDIARAVITALNWSVLVPADRIKVTVSKGWVTLEGHVDWEYQKRVAERAVRDLVGVRGVSNLIEARPQVRPTDVKAAIDPDSLAAQNLEPGDVILSVNRHDVNSVTEFNKLANDAKGKVLLRIMHQGQPAFVVVSPEGNEEQ